MCIYYYLKDNTKKLDLYFQLISLFSAFKAKYHIKYEKMHIWYGMPVRPYPKEELVIPGSFEKLKPLIRSKLEERSKSYIQPKKNSAFTEVNETTVEIRFFMEITIPEKKDPIPFSGSLYMTSFPKYYADVYVQIWPQSDEDVFDTCWRRSPLFQKIMIDLFEKPFRKDYFGIQAIYFGEMAFPIRQYNDAFRVFIPGFPGKTYADIRDYCNFKKQAWIPSLCQACPHAFWQDPNWHPIECDFMGKIHLKLGTIQSILKCHICSNLFPNFKSDSACLLNVVNPFDCKEFTPRENGKKWKSQSKKKN